MTKHVWQDDAACKGLTAVWYSFAAADIVHARAVCATCPVLDECRAYVMREYASNQPEGIWAGLDQAERRKVYRQRYTKRDAVVCTP